MRLRIDRGERLAGGGRLCRRRCVSDTAESGKGKQRAARRVRERGTRKKKRGRREEEAELETWAASSGPSAFRSSRAVSPSHSWAVMFGPGPYGPFTWAHEYLRPIPHTAAHGVKSAAAAKRLLRSPCPMLLTSVAVGSLVAAGAANATEIWDPHPLHGSSGLVLPDLGIGDWFGGLLFSAGQQANEAVQDQLSALSFSSLAVIFGAGLVTSLSPCTLSVLPLTLGYIGAFAFKQCSDVK